MTGLYLFETIHTFTKRQIILSLMIIKRHCSLPFVCIRSTQCLTIHGHSPEEVLFFSHTSTPRMGGLRDSIAPKHVRDPTVTSVSAILVRRWEILTLLKKIISRQSVGWDTTELVRKQSEKKVQQASECRTFLCQVWCTQDPYSVMHVSTQHTQLQ